MDRFIKEKVNTTLSVLESEIRETVYEFPELLMLPSDYKKPQEKPAPTGSPSRATNAYRVGTATSGSGPLWKSPKKRKEKFMPSG